MNWNGRCDRETRIPASSKNSMVEEKKNTQSASEALLSFLSTLFVHFLIFFFGKILTWHETAAFGFPEPFSFGSQRVAPLS
jgi:hypothetical protein